MDRLSKGRRLPVVGTAYVLLLLGAYLWWLLQSPYEQLSVLAASSTDLDHLSRVPWLVLPASSLWSGHLFGYWAIVAIVCLGALELLRGPVVTLAVGMTAHVVSTLVSQGVVALRIAAGELGTSARHVLDVGPSYVVAACAAAVIASPRAPRAVRIACGVTVMPLLVTAFDVSLDAQVATVGHGVALLLGALAGARAVDSMQAVPQR